MRKRVLGLGAVLILTPAIGVWWWTRMTPPVTEAEARAYLDRIVVAARARDFNELCHLNGAVLNCERVLNEFKLRSAVPSDPPTVVGSRYHRKTPGGTAGRVLVVTGTTSCGKPYRTEVFVFRETRFNFKAINAVYWSNFKLIESNNLSPGGDPPPTCP